MTSEGHGSAKSASTSSLGDRGACATELLLGRSTGVPASASARQRAGSRALWMAAAKRRVMFHTSQLPLRARVPSMGVYA